MRPLESAKALERARSWSTSRPPDSFGGRRRGRSVGHAPMTRTRRRRPRSGPAPLRRTWRGLRESPPRELVTRTSPWHRRLRHAMVRTNPREPVARAGHELPSGALAKAASHDLGTKQESIRSIKRRSNPSLARRLQGASAPAFQDKPAKAARSEVTAQQRDRASSRRRAPALRRTPPGARGALPTPRGLVPAPRPSADSDAKARLPSHGAGATRIRT